ncbi:MAG: methyltransferase domain-containing protein [Alphaproteobacteria bacterium]|nr:methyltransferase domain-containing protein [Alphaproteobacteria bacterium]
MAKETDGPALDGRSVARDYYDSADADAFYQTIWGGEDIHVGLYGGDPGMSIKDASRKTVAAMARRPARLSPGAKVLDIGAGYGGAARALAREFGAHVTCLNLSTVENERNRRLTSAAGLSDLISVVDGSFDAIPEPDASFDVVWSQDAILHAPDRRAVLAEVARVIRPGGDFIFTDPMQTDDLADAERLRPIYDRIHLPDLASVGFYRRELSALGFEEVDVAIMTEELGAHYARVRDDLAMRRDELNKAVSDAFVDRMIAGLKHWVDGAAHGLLVWGILHFRKK